MILSAEEHGQDAHRPCGLVEVEPKDGAIDRHMPQTGGDIFAQRAPTGRSTKPLGGKTKAIQALCSLLECVGTGAPKLLYASKRWSKISSKSRSASAANSVRHAMLAPLAIQHPSDPVLHPVGRHESAGSALCHKGAESLRLRLLGFGLLAKQVKPLLHHGVDA